MSKSTARRSRHKVSSGELPLTAQTSSKSLHLVPLVNSAPRQGTIEPQDGSAASLAAAIPEPPIVKASSGLERSIQVDLNSSKHVSVTQPTCPTETVPTALVHPTGSGASRRAIAEAWIEQEEINFSAVAESTEAEISRLRGLIEEQKAILTRAKEKRDANIERARGTIEGNDEMLPEEVS